MVQGVPSLNNMKNKSKFITYGVVGVGLIVAAFFFFGGNKTDNSSSQNTNIPQTVNLDIPLADSSVLKISASITGRSYTPKQIDVPYGATVELTVKNNDDEQHGLFLQDFGVQDFVGPRQTKTISFVANRRGQSATFCSTTHPEKLIINVN